MKVSQCCILIFVELSFVQYCYITVSGQSGLYRRVGTARMYHRRRFPFASANGDAVEVEVELLAVEVQVTMFSF